MNKEIISLFESGKLENAKEKVLKQLQQDPNNYRAHNILGAILTKENKFDNAIIHFKKSVDLKSDYAEGYNNLGTAYQKLNNLKDALANYEKALKYKPNFAEAYNNSGTGLRLSGKFEEAINRYSKAIKLKPDYTDAFTNLGNTFVEVGEFEKAIYNFECALKIDTKYIEALINLGNTFAKMEKFEQAIDYHKRAIKIDPNHAEAYSCIGNVLAQMEKFEEGISYHRKALKINPKFVEANFNESIILLTLGKFDTAWKKYENRFDLVSSPPIKYEKNKIWNGEYLDGTLLVWSEQGIGDHILFSSMLSDLKKCAKNIILETDKRLVNLMKRYFIKVNFTNIEVKDSEEKPKCEFDKHIAIGSLGQYLRKSNSLFKATPIKYLIPDPDKEKKLKERLANIKKFKVGICWKTLNKKQKFRNINLDQMLPILSNKNCHFFNLQFGNTNVDLEKFRLKNNIDINTIKDIDNYNDIDGNAALINCLDLVITIQNSTAHLSGALGKKTWIMLAKNARWHWLINEKKSIWYPSVQLFRQKTSKNWDTVIKDISIELKKIT
tara:strand:- start:231 stop:1889 length:1659 start_codon:yes stop_codon:yes gene_type:complete